MIYGSMAWVRQTGGEVRGLERWGQLLRLLKARTALRFERAPTRLAMADVGRALDEVTLPDSKAVQGALAVITGLGPPALVGHGLRTFAWGTLLGLRDGLRWDREAFCLAALLHDLALARRDHSRCCFASDGALQSMELLATLGVDAVRRERIAEAICLHLRIEVPPSLGVEAHLVNAGSALDVVGRRAREIPKPVREAVLQRHPRGELPEVLDEALGAELRQHPTSRAGRWVALGFRATR